MSKPSLSLSESHKQYFILVLVAGCLIGVVGFGPRSALGLFLPPMSAANSWGRDVFALALAIQVLMWGAALPLAGALADRFGIVLVMSGGAILYSIGLVLMSYSTTPGMLTLIWGPRRLRHCRTALFTPCCRLVEAPAENWRRSLPSGAGTAAAPAGSVFAARGRADPGLRLAERC